MFSTETLPKCTIIKIHDLLPKKINTREIKSTLKDGFLFIAGVNGKLLVHQNLGFEPNQIEKEHLKKYISTWGGGESVDILNGVLKMELPSFLMPFYNEIDSLPGCRIYPNLLRIGGDVYICIEYHGSVSKQISRIAMEFLAEDHLFRKELIYSGPQEEKLPYLLGLYRDSGNSLEDFIVIKTVWEFDPADLRNQNQGVFQNTGSYIPKCFVHDSTDRLIFRKNREQILGNAPYAVVDQSERIVEFEVVSKFYSDFYNEIISRYCGPIFMHMEVTPTKQFTYHIIEKKQEAAFIKGMAHHWKQNARSSHVNYIDVAESLPSLLGRL